MRWLPFVLSVALAAPQQPTSGNGQQGQNQDPGQGGQGGQDQGGQGQDGQGQGGQGQPAQGGQAGGGSQQGDQNPPNANCASAMSNLQSFYDRPECSFLAQIEPNEPNTEMIAAIRQFCGDGCLANAPDLISQAQAACVDSPDILFTLDTIRKTLDIDLEVYCTATSNPSDDSRGGTDGLCWIERSIRSHEAHGSVVAPYDMDPSALCIECVQNQYKAFAVARPDFQAIITDQPGTPSANMAQLMEDREGPWLDAVNATCNGNFADDTSPVNQVGTPGSGNGNANDDGTSNAQSGAEASYVKAGSMILVIMSVLILGA